jgi:hypothetical protein
MMTISRAFLAAGLVAGLALAGRPSVAASDRVDHLLSASRAALGGSALDAVRVYALESTVDFGGLSGTGRAWIEIGGPRFAESVDAGPLSGFDGYDGRDVWNTDSAGVVWADGSVQGRTAAISQGFFENMLLWRTGRGGAGVTDGGTRTEGARTYDLLEVTVPGAAVPSELWLDAATHLSARIVTTVAGIASTTTLADYRAVDGIMLPGKSTNSTNGNEGTSTLVRATLDPQGAAHLAKPQEHLTDYSIAGGAGETSVPIDIIDNHIYLNVMLNGKGPYRFLFDTGGLNVIDPAVAKEIGEQKSGSLQGSGVGEATEAFGFTKVRSLQFGAATMTGQPFAVIPVRGAIASTSGEPIDGLIGFEVLARFVTTFDYAHKHVIFRLPAAAHVSPQAHAIPFVFGDRTPQVGCEIDGIVAVCAVDTGARDSITLLSPFVAAHPNLTAAGTSETGVDGFGLGGPAFGKLTRLTSLQLGDLKIADLVADLSSQTKGAFANPYEAANVGGGVWRRFSVTFDYPHQMIYLEPNATFANRDSYERAGLFLMTKAGAITVLDARAGTPAAAAGIAKGDVIASIDGKPAGDLRAVRALLLEPAGTVLHLGLTAADGTHRDVTLTLRDYV